MHLLYLGCAKRLMENLLSPSSHKARLGPSHKNELNRRSKLIKADIPEEFPRKIRAVEHHSRYKAVEFKFFALYAAAVLLKKLVPDKLYNHFMLFTTACRLLSEQNSHLNIYRGKNILD